MSDLVQVSGSNRYDCLTRWLHWIFVVGIIYASIVGYSLALIKDRPALHDFLSHLNASLATVLIPLFVLRLVWKFMRTNPSPPILGPRQLMMARAVQSLLYLIIFEVLVSGFLMMPHGYMFFDVIFIPTPFEKGAMTELFAQLHSIGNICLVVIVVLHVAGVISNNLFKGVDVLRRMW